MCDVKNIMHRAVGAEICGVLPTKNHQETKILRTYYLCAVGIRVFIALAFR
jgi:hypothetical protein